jgi:hypothetical protein
MMVATPAAVKPSCGINGISALTWALDGIDALSRFVATPSMEN